MAGIDPQQSEYGIEGHGLAGTVPTEQTDHFGSVDMDRHIVQDRFPAKFLGDRDHRKSATVGRRGFHRMGQVGKLICSNGRFALRRKPAR